MSNPKPLEQLLDHRQESHADSLERMWEMARRLRKLDERHQPEHAWNFDANEVRLTGRCTCGRYLPCPVRAILDGREP